jgi:hypothetical protein
LAELVGVERGEVRWLSCPVLESDFASDICAGWKQAHDRERGHGFSGTGFADQAQHLAWIDGEAQVADCGDRAGVRGRIWSAVGIPSRARPRHTREFYCQVPDVEERPHRRIVPAVVACETSLLEILKGAYNPLILKTEGAEW